MLQLLFLISFGRMVFVLLTFTSPCHEDAAMGQDVTLPGTAGVKTNSKEAGQRPCAARWLAPEPGAHWSGRELRGALWGSWGRRGPVLAGHDEGPPTAQWTGPGQPSATAESSTRTWDRSSGPSRRYRPSRYRAGPSGQPTTYDVTVIGPETTSVL